MTSTNVLTQLESIGFEKSEILDLFSATKLEWGANFRGNNIEVCDPKNPSNYLLRANIKNSKITNWKLGPACTQGVLDQVKTYANEIRTQTEQSHILSRIMFSQEELQGRWRYMEKFQVLPCIQEMQIGSGLDWFAAAQSVSNDEFAYGPPFPLLIEVSVPKISSDWLQYHHGIKILERYEHLLCTLIDGLSNTTLWPIDRQWIAIKSKDTYEIEYHLLRSSIGTKRGGQYDSWTEWTGKSAPMLNSTSAAQESITSKQRELFLPDDLKGLLDAYSNLDEKTKKAFSRSTYYFTLGQKLLSNFDLAVLNFSIAIECLLDSGGSDRCPQCGKEKVGPTKRFKDFMTKYSRVEGSLQDRRNQLYAIRCLIAHGGRSMHTDFSTFSLARDRDTPLIMKHLVRKALTEWLRAQKA